MVSSEKMLMHALKAMRYVVVTNSENRIIYLDKDYQKILGVDESTSYGRPIQEIVTNSGIPRVAESKQVEMGRLFTMKNGETVVVNRFPIIENGKFLGVVTTASFSQLSSVQKLQMEIEKLLLSNASYKNRLIELEPGRSLDKIIGSSYQTSNIKQTISQFADSTLPILITGETGTGKEVVADAVHSMSSRRNEPFVKINCAAIPKDLLESELFGYEPGAFTGANREGKIGKFEHANQGTILLDEIGEMPMALQVKLLRVLQENEIERIGGSNSIQIDVRIICTTNQLLLEAIEKGVFRRDLYYRINAVEIQIPPLRERKDDIPPLVEYFINKFVAEYGLGAIEMSKSAMDTLLAHSWPGNVRELRHVMERACFAAGTGRLDSDHFGFLSLDLSRQEPEVKHEDNLELAVAELEKEKIHKALEEAGWNKAAAAKILKISRSMLYRRMEKHNIGDSDEI